MATELKRVEEAGDRHRVNGRGQIIEAYAYDNEVLYQVSNVSHAAVVAGEKVLRPPSEVLVKMEVLNLPVDVPIYVETPNVLV